MSSVASLLTSCLFAVVARAPIFIGVKQNGVPMFFQASYKRNLAGYALELARLMTAGRRRGRICRIENKKNPRILSKHSPPVPFDMLQVSLRSTPLSQHLLIL